MLGTERAEPTNLSTEAVVFAVVCVCLLLCCCAVVVVVVQLLLLWCGSCPRLLAQLPPLSVGAARPCLRRPPCEGVF